MLEFLGKDIIFKRNLVYLAAYVVYGMYFVTLGPLVPYLAQESGRVETQYSFLFTWRAFGMLCGALIYNYFQQRQRKPSPHQVLVFSCGIIIISNCFFIWSSSFFYQGLWSFITSVNYFLMQITIDVCMISMNDHVDKLFLLLGGCFGIGSALGPILLRFMGKSSYYVFAVLLGALIPIFIILPDQLKEQDHVQASGKKKTANMFTENLLAFSQFIYLGAVLIIMAWSPSYAVMTKSYTKQEATIFPFVYQFFNVASKFMWIFIPLKCIAKLKFTVAMIVTVSIICLILAKLSLYKWSLYLECVGMGIFMSPIASLLFALSSEFNRPLTGRQASKLGMWGVIGEGVLSAFCAWMMEFFSIDMYFYFSIFVCLMLWLTVYAIVNELEKSECEDQKNECELLQTRQL